MSLYEGRLQGCRGPADGSLEIVRDGSGWVTVRILTSSLAALGDMQLDAPEARRAGAELLSPRVADDLRRILPRACRGRRWPPRTWPRSGGSATLQDGSDQWESRSLTTA